MFYFMKQLQLNAASPSADEYFSMVLEQYASGDKA